MYPSFTAKRVRFPHMRRSIFALGLLALSLVISAPSVLARQSRQPLTAANIEDLTTLLKLEDTRQFDEAALSKIWQSTHPEVRRRAAISVGRIADPAGAPLLEKMRADRNATVAAAVVFATGQLRLPGNIAWLGSVLSAPATPPAVAREAAQALGKLPNGNAEAAAQARAALSAYLAKAPTTAAAAPVVGEALLSWGRYTIPKSDVAPVVRWVTSTNVETRWRAAWALFRARDAAGMPHLMKLVDDASPEVRYWAVRGLAPAAVDAAKADRAVAVERLRVLFNKDADRRVRTEALRALLQYDDEKAFGALVNALYSPDTWISVSAAEAASRFGARARVLAPLVVDVADDKAPIALRITALNALVTLAPQATKTFELAQALAKSETFAARSAAVSALGRLGDEGRAMLAKLGADPAIASLAQPGGQTMDTMIKAQLARGGGAGNRGGGGGGGAAAGGGGAAGGGAAGAGRAGGAAAETPAPRRTWPARPDAEYRALVEKWIVPAYNGAPAPRAIWETPKGAIELELYAGDAPLAMEQFLRLVESGDIVGTEFTRLVPDFVAQQQGIRNAVTLRDEVNQRGLTRANLSTASAGLDTGRPGYTLGHTPQPHNEGNFTSLGRVIRGMDVVDKLELGDRITAARMVK